jgi:SOS response regulatory protein OraA/RecX
MDKLEPTAREAIKKMNSDRLRMKLAKVGVDEEEIAAMSREQLMHAWAERVAEGREEPLPTATASIKAQG